jgi:hypothetical protein
MLCERCQTREATVHRSLVPWPPNEISNHHFCDTCDAAVSVENPVYGHPAEVPAAVVADVEHITASEYLTAEERARNKALHMPAFKHILNELGRFPKTRSRLGFEFLEMAWKTLERRGHPGFLIATSGNFWNSAKPVRPKEYAALMEKVMRRIFELAAQPESAESVPESSSSALSPSFCWSLVFAAIALKKADPSCYTAIMNEFKTEVDQPGLDTRRQVVLQVEERIEKMEKNTG